MDGKALLSKYGTLEKIVTRIRAGFFPHLTGRSYATHRRESMPQETARSLRYQLNGDSLDCASSPQIRGPLNEPMLGTFGWYCIEATPARLTPKDLREARKVAKRMASKPGPHVLRSPFVERLVEMGVSGHQALKWYTELVPEGKRKAGRPPSAVK